MKEMRKMIGAAWRAGCRIAPVKWAPLGGRHGFLAHDVAAVRLAALRSIAYTDDARDGARADTPPADIASLCSAEWRVLARRSP